jgi:hypothetical protein
MSEVDTATDYHSLREKGCDNNRWKAVTDVTALCISHTPPPQLGGFNVAHMNRGVPYSHIGGSIPATGKRVKRVIPNEGIEPAAPSEKVEK